MLEKIDYQGWENCYRLHNKNIELIVTADVGPRILHFSYLGAENLLQTYPDELGKSGDEQFRIYGGHRLWHAPEHIVRTYYADNQPVEVELLDNGAVRFTSPSEITTGIQKSLDIWLHPQKPEVEIIHRFKNHNLWTIETALWALTVMALGGTAIIPLPPHQTHSENLLPATNLALWGYTDMSDARWTWGSEFIMLQQTANPAPQKIGLLNSNAWLGYVNHDYLFIKMFDTQTDAVYPDLGVNCEVYTNHEMLELETLSSLQSIEPQKTIEHRETWHLVRGVSTPQTENDIRQNIIPLLNAIT